MLKNRIDVRLENNEIDYFKWTSSPSNMSNKIFGNRLTATRKSKSYPQT